MIVAFFDDELFTVAAALECAMKESERSHQYKLADRFAELYKRVDDTVRRNIKHKQVTAEIAEENH